MPNLTIGNQTFNYPNAGTEAGWGEDATGWAQAVTELLAALSTPGDILPASFAIQNNVSSATDITGMFFNSGIVRAANIFYAVYRVSDGSPNGVAESGTIQIDLNETAPVGQKWQMTILKNGNGGTSFSITDGGQVQYTSTDIGTVNYQGVIKFSAKVLSK